MTQGSGRAIKMESSNQFVPLFTNPQEVLQTRHKARHALGIRLMENSETDPDNVKATSFSWLLSSLSLFLQEILNLFVV